MYYVAYGSNMNVDQMKVRCPEAKAVGTTFLEGYRLLFRGNLGFAYLTVENATSTGYTVWAKIAKSEYTGKKDDPWQEVTEGEKFEDGYYYMVAVEMLVVDSYYADETTVGTINGREHNDLFGDFLLNKESAVIDEVPYGLLLLTIYEPVGEETVPSTGENSPIYLMLAVMALSGVTFAVVDKKRKK